MANSKKSPYPRTEVRNFVINLGDQLDRESVALMDFDPSQDVVWMAEVSEESTHVWSHRARIALFLSAMRHFRNDLQERGFRVFYRELSDRDNQGTLAGELMQSLTSIAPKQIILVEPGDYRVLQSIQKVVRTTKIPLLLLPDSHFLSSRQDFAAFAEGKKQLRMEFFYREMRKRFGVLMKEGKPAGGKWNYDPENRKRFPKNGPKNLAKPLSFPPDEITKKVLDLVNRFFPNHPGSLDHFDWPVTPEQAELELVDFLDNRLAQFGDFQDAMWSGESYLYHSRLSSSFNLKLLNPRVAIQAAEKAYYLGQVPLPGVEGFIRQILGWREFVRGIYWHYMPEYAQNNALAAKEPLPDFFWTGKTAMFCLAETIGQTLEFGYAHHIQRLMVTGLYALLLGVRPEEVHRWYLAVYVDAVEWVELPNTLGMSQYADGGLLASKPYVATGKYIQRMSNYCDRCPYDPAKSSGEDACPFTTLYWDFLARHRQMLQGNPRMKLQVRNLDRFTKKELSVIQNQATYHRQQVENQKI